MPESVGTRLTILISAVIAIGLIMIAMLTLGIRSMRLDDLRAEHRELHEQRDMIFKSIDDANKERHELTDALHRLEARLEKAGK